MTHALTMKNKVTRNIIPNNEAMKLAPRSNIQGFTVSVFVSDFSIFNMISFNYYE
tara:strand:+ start:381 stop:545 length:165 start_codon:yes stop_codon:yes gene_type:complete